MRIMRSSLAPRLSPAHTPALAGSLSCLPQHCCPVQRFSGLHAARTATSKAHRCVAQPQLAGQQWAYSSSSVATRGIEQFARQHRLAGTLPHATAASQTAPVRDEEGRNEILESLKGSLQWLNRKNPPAWLWRSIAALMLGGQVMARMMQGKVHWRNMREQLELVGPRSLGVSLLTASFVGMVFTIQFVREFAKLGLTRSVGGVLALALSRELTPVVTCIVLAGRVGSAFAAELGTMAVSEQTDSLRVLGTDPVDYLVTPRVLSCMIAGPLLNVMCFTIGIAASTLLAQAVYDVPANVILNSAAKAVGGWDIATSMIKAWVFGVIISVVSCAWGFTTTGGAKGVGESTTSAVVISLVGIFIADFFLSFLFFQGQGDALKQCM